MIVLSMGAPLGLGTLWHRVVTGGRDMPAGSRAYEISMAQ